MLEVHGPDDPERKAGLAAVFQRLNTTLLHGAASDAADAPLLAYLAAEDTFTKAPSKQDDAANNAPTPRSALPDLGSLPPDDVPSVPRRAGRAGRCLSRWRQNALCQPPEKTREQALMRRAVDPGVHPFTPAELSQFINRAQQPPAVTCALTLKFYDNVGAMAPADAAALLRAVLRSR